MFDVLFQTDLAVEILDQPAPPDRKQVERIKQRVEQRDVAGSDFDIGGPERRKGFQAEREHLGVGCGAVLATEGFDAGLQKLAPVAAAIAKHRSEIAEPGRLAGYGGGKILARDRNGEVGTQAQFLAARVGGEIEAFANVLSGEVEER